MGFACPVGLLLPRTLQRKFAGQIAASAAQRAGAITSSLAEGASHHKGAHRVTLHSFRCFGNYPAAAALAAIGMFKHRAAPCKQDTAPGWLT